MLKPPEFDVFISYRRCEPDQTLARERLAPELRAEKLRVCLDDDAFIPGKPLIQQMEQAVLNSRFTVMLISRAYLKGRFARLENLMAQRLGDREARRRLIAIVLEPCDDHGLREQAELCLDLSAEPDFATLIAKLIAAIRGKS